MSSRRDLQDGCYGVSNCVLKITYNRFSLLEACGFPGVRQPWGGRGSSMGRYSVAAALCCYLRTRRLVVIKVRLSHNESRSSDAVAQKAHA